jgi:hypothetical protein
MAGNGQSGQRKDKLIRDALMVAAHRVEEGDPEGRKKLAVAAAKVVDMAVAGDMQAFNAMADRIDGKPHQSMDIATTRETPITDWTLEAIDAELARRGIAPSTPPVAVGQARPDRVH